MQFLHSYFPYDKNQWKESLNSQEEFLKLPHFSLYSILSGIQFVSSLSDINCCSLEKGFDFQFQSDEETILSIEQVKEQDALKEENDITYQIQWNDEQNSTNSKLLASIHIDFKKVGIYQLLILIKSSLFQLNEIASIIKIEVLSSL